MAGKSYMTSNNSMFITMLFSAVFRRKSRALMAVIATLVGAATLFCLAAICLVVPQQMSDEMRAYGANIIVTPIEGEWKNGIDRARVLHTIWFLQKVLCDLLHIVTKTCVLTQLRMF